MDEKIKMTQIDEIENEQDSNENVKGTQIHQGTMAEWFQRNNDKNHITNEVKRRKTTR